MSGRLKVPGTLLRELREVLRRHGAQRIEAWTQYDVLMVRFELNGETLTWQCRRVAETATPGD